MNKEMVSNICIDKFQYVNVKYRSIIFKNKNVSAFSKCYRLFGHPVDWNQSKEYRQSYI